MKIFHNMAYEVTIGIPVYNVDKYIQNSLNSALEQTFQNIEFLICDDCSTDKSMDVVCEYQQNHPRGKDIHIVRQPYNMGVSAARNRIVNEAKGRFLYFMDSDDTIEANTISLLMEHQKRLGADIVFGSYDKIETYNGNRVVDAKIYSHQDIIDEDGLAKFANSHYGSIQSSVCNYCVDVFLLRKSGIRFIDVNYWEDMAFMFELVTICKRAVLLPNITYHYLCHYDSLSNYQQRDHIYKDEVLRSVRVADYMKQQSLKQKHKSYFPSRCYNAAMTSFYIVCHILKNQEKITPAFTVSELRSIMKYPVNFWDIKSFDSMRWHNLFLCLLSKLPSKSMVWAFQIIGKRRGLI